MVDRLKTAFASYIGSAVWWLCDKLWGDRLFNLVKPMIPDWAINGMPLSDVVRWGLSYGPPIILLVLGTVLFLSAHRKIAALSTTTSAGDAKKSSATMAVNAVALPPAKYSKAQINKIVEAIDAIYPPVLETERALIFGKGLAGSLEAIIRDNGAEVFLNRMDELRLKLNAASAPLDKAVEDYGLYAEVCSIVGEKKNFHDPFFASYNELAGILREIPEKLSAPPLAIFVEAKKATFVSRVSEYLSWAEQKKKALTEYREWYLRRPTTD